MSIGVDTSVFSQVNELLWARATKVDPMATLRCERSASPIAE